MKKKKIRYRKYIVVDDKYGWYWMRERWSVIRCAATVYTKRTLPESIRGAGLRRVEANDVTTWKYGAQRDERTASVMRLYGEL